MKRAFLAGLLMLPLGFVGGVAGASAASPDDGVVLAPGSITFDVPEGNGWAGYWRSRLLVSRVSKDTIGAAWGSWGYLNYGALRSEINSIRAYYAARGMYDSSLRLSAEYDARQDFYSDGWSRDASAASLFGPSTFKIVPYGPTATVSVTQPGTYTWQTAHVTSYYTQDDGMQHFSEPKSFVITAPPAPVVTPVPTPSGSRPPATGRVPSQAAATTPPTPSCATQRAAVARASAALRAIQARISRATTPSARKRLAGQKRQAVAAKGRATSALSACQRP
jgi:hypothetical protein